MTLTEALARTPFKRRNQGSSELVRHAESVRDERTICTFLTLPSVAVSTHSTASFKVSPDGRFPFVSTRYHNRYTERVSSSDNPDCFLRVCHSKCSYHVRITFGKRFNLPFVI